MDTIDEETVAAVGKLADCEVFFRDAKAIVGLHFPFFASPFPENAALVCLDVFDAVEGAAGGGVGVGFGIVEHGGDVGALSGHPDAPPFTRFFQANDEFALGKGLHFAFVPKLEIFFVFGFGEAELFVIGKRDAWFGVLGVFLEPFGVCFPHFVDFGDILLDFLGRNYRHDFSLYRYVRDEVVGKDGRSLFLSGGRESEKE